MGELEQRSSSAENRETARTLWLAGVLSPPHQLVGTGETLGYCATPSHYLDLLLLSRWMGNRERWKP